MTPWKRAKARERNAGYREGYAAGLRDAHRVSERHVATGADAVAVADDLRRLAMTAQRGADIANGAS
jgi:flagellar biosynthesis/type III secretory pathway protein FliH